MLPFDEILFAEQNIRPYLPRSPLIRCYPLEKELKLKGRLFLKCEHIQWTGSFKIRGALNALLQLSSIEKQKGVVTRSSGNFAQSLAFAGSLLQIPVTVVMPSNAPQIKKEMAQKFGATVHFSESDQKNQLAKVFEIAQTEHLAILSPFDHLHVIAGAGTMALEIWEALPTITQYFCQIGGGGLMGGTATALKHLNSLIEVTGIEPQGAKDYFLSRQAGLKVRLDHIDTIADGLRAPQVGELTWPLLQRHVDRLVLVTDQEIIQAMRYLSEKMGMIVEPSGAASFAALLHYPERLKPHADAVCVLSGGNVDRVAFDRWVIM